VGRERWPRRLIGGASGDGHGSPGEEAMVRTYAGESSAAVNMLPAPRTPGYAS
jgi:hypothetical protein